MTEEKKTPAVDPLTRVLNYSSVSQLERFERCPMSWWLRYIEGAREKESKSREIGTECHRQLEHYLKTGEDVLSRITAPGKRLLPEIRYDAPGMTDLFVEYGLNEKPKPTPDTKFFPPEESKLVLDGVPFIGYVDLHHIRDEYVGEDGITRADPKNTIEVLDHKTTGGSREDPWCWAKRSEDLINTAQMAGYAIWASRSGLAMTHVRLSHIYYATKGTPQAIKRTALVGVDLVAKRCYELEATVGRMKEVAQIQKRDDCPGNLDACEAFGGCDFKPICPRYRRQTPIQKVRMALLIKPKTPAPIPPPVNSAPNPQLAVKTAPQRKITIIDEPDETSRPSQVITHACEAKVGLVYRLPDDTLVISLGIQDGKFAFVPTAGGPPITISGVERIVPQPMPGLAAKAEEAPAPTLEAAPDENAAPAASQAAPEACAETAQLEVPPPKRRGRPAKAAKPAPVEAEETQVVDDTPQNAPVETKLANGHTVVIQPSAPATAPLPVTLEGSSPDELLLFVGCCPNIAAESLDGYVAELHANLRETFGVDDIRFVSDKNSPLAYGAWKGALAALVRASPPPSRPYVAQRGELTDVVIEALAPLRACGEGLMTGELLCEPEHWKGRAQ